MTKFCSDCTYLKLDSRDIYGKFYCEKKLDWHRANEEACYRYCNAYNRKGSDSEDAYKYSLSHNDTNCYLTTMLCKILGMEDNNIYLSTIRNFRNNVLQNDKQYKKILVEYDIIGPKIAENLYNDPANRMISNVCLQKYIIPITNHISLNENNEAIKLYMSMTNNLKNIYNIQNKLTIDEINNADISLSGHGVYKIKKITP